MAYRSVQVCALAGITARQLDHWTRIGLVTPSIAEATGSGSQRLWSHVDVAVIRTIAAALGTTSSSVSNDRLRRLRSAVPAIRELVERHTDVVLVISAAGIAVADNAEHLHALVRLHQAVTVLAVDAATSASPDTTTTGVTAGEAEIGTPHVGASHDDRPGGTRGGARSTSRGVNTATAAVG